jgi:hypothetical protein
VKWRTWHRLLLGCRLSHCREGAKMRAEEAMQSSRKLLRQRLCCLEASLSLAGDGEASPSLAQRHEGAGKDSLDCCAHVKMEEPKLIRKELLTAEERHIS